MKKMLRDGVVGGIWHPPAAQAAFHMLGIKTHIREKHMVSKTESRWTIPAEAEDFLRGQKSSSEVIWSEQRPI